MRNLKRFTRSMEGPDRVVLLLKLRELEQLKELLTTVESEMLAVSADVRTYAVQAWSKDFQSGGGQDDAAEYLQDAAGRRAVQSAEGSLTKRSKEEVVQVKEKKSVPITFGGYDTVRVVATFRT